MRTLSLIILLLSQPGPALAELPPAFAATYQLHSDGLQLGIMQRRFEPDHRQGHRLVSNSHTTGLVALFRDDTLLESSLWQQQPQVRLLRYEYLRTSKDKHKHRLIEIDRSKASIANLAADNPWTLPLEQEPLDPHLLQLLVMDRLSAGEQQPHFTIIDDGRIQQWHFSYTGNEHLRLPAGAYDTQVLRYRNGKAGMTLWCAAALNFLPVRIEHLDHKGKSTIAELSAIEWQTSAVDP